MSGTGPISLYLNGVERIDEHGLEWDWSTSEQLGATGDATLIVQDRDNTLEPAAHWDVKLVIKSNAHVLWRGEVTSFSLELPDKFPWRRWNLQCSDYNGEMPLRLVGAYDGKIWIDTSGLGIFVNIDPYASPLETDKLTVQSWFDHYFRVNDEAVDTDTFVVSYLENLDKMYMQEPSYGNLQQALEDLAALIIQNLQFWIDPDLNFHWVAIPAWQDLLVDAIATELDDTLSTSALMFPEGSIAGLEFAPYTVSDVGDLETDIGFSDLKFELDGGAMPEQVYVKGATGYVYNSAALEPSGETKTVVHSPTAGTADRYELTFLATTKLWHTDSTGYVSTSYDTCGASGPYDVKWVRVAWNEARNKGGNYWKLLEGPNAGKLVDDNTNVLAYYGEIEVVKVTSPDVIKSTVGVGGSGWTNEVDQDPTKRQVYLEAISTTVAERDSVGGQAIYRGLFETLRGSVIARGFDGWRVGQLLRVQDARLPDKYNEHYYVIQQVTAKPVSGQDYREYTLNFGDGPESRYTAERRGGPVEWPSPVNQIHISAFDLSPGPNSTQTITGQLVNGMGAPWAVSGKTVNWSFECYNRLGALQTGQGSISPKVSITDRFGKASTRLTTGSGTNLVYFVFANVKAT